MADPAKKKADDAPATDEQLAGVLSDDPESAEEAFAEAFDEFASKDDTVTADAPAKGPDDGDKAGAPAPADKAEDQPASGEKPPDADEAASTGAADTGDIWADATPEQRAAYQAAQQENRSHRGRLSALDRARAADSRALPPAADKAADATAAAEDAENWEQFKTEYPEVAGPLETRFENRLATLETENANLRSQVDGITDGQLQDAIDTEEALLLQRHPDWEQLTASEDFTAWLPGQPRYVQEGFARNGTAIVDGQEAASLIDLFKDDHAATPQPGDKPAKDTTNDGKGKRRARRLESAVSTESGQAGPGAGPPEGDFDAAFDHFASQP